MQDLVAEPLEKRLQELTWYDRVETTTRPGYAYMTVTLKDSTPPSVVQEEFYQARKKLGDEARNLPSGVLGPFVNDEYSDVSFALYALKARGMPMRDLVRQAEVIRQDLLHVPGIKKINILGERSEHIFVEFSYAKLATLGVSAQDIVSALQRQNTVTPAGSIDTQGPQVFIRIDGAYDGVQAIADTPIVAAGRTLKLSDVAEVNRGYEDPPTYIIRHQGEPTIVLAAVMQDGWDGLALGKALKDRAAAIAQTLPLGMTLEKVTDQAVNITSAVDEFMMKFAMALGVVLVVSLLSLGWRVGIVVAAAVPLTLAVVFLIMLETGRFFDRITLGALILALGLLVDDAIIAIEVMVVKMEEGMDRVKAAAYAWSHTAAPMLSGTLVTIAGFLPVGFARSTAGEYAGNIFWVVGFALIVSWIVAVVFTPYLGCQDAARDQTNRRRSPGDLRHTELSAAATAHRIRRAPQVRNLWRRRHRFRAFRRRHGRRQTAVLPDVRPPRSAGGGSSAGRHQHRDDDRHGREARTLAGAISPRPRSSRAMSVRALPASSSRWRRNCLIPAFAKIVVLTPDAEAREALKHRLRGAVSQGLAPEAYVRVTQLVFGPYTPFPVEFRVMGPDPAQLYAISERALDIMRGVPDVRQANRDWGNRTPVLRFIPDQDRLNLIGLSPAEVGQQLQFLLTGIAVTQVREDIRNVPIVARSAGGERLDPTRLADFSLMSRDGRPIPLDQIGHSEVRLEEPILKRRDRTPVVTIRSDINEATQPPEVSKQIMNGPSAADRIPSGRLSHRTGRIDRGGSQGQHRAG